MINWPGDFFNNVQDIFKDESKLLLESLELPAPVSIRMNPWKSTDQFNSEEKIEWSTMGHYLKQRPSFTLDPLFHAGCYYVQEASSQFLEVLFNEAIQTTDQPVVLDLCAAPGGKSTHLLSLLNGKGVLISNEIIPGRNKTLQENCIKWGSVNSIVTQNESSVFGKLKNVFDVVVVDAPCSGEGLFRRDPDAANEWSLDAVRHCAVRQTKILEDIIPSIKPGGYLIYSTCTFESAENENQILKLIEESDFEKINIDVVPDGVVKSELGYSFYPHKIKGEGFFITLLRKKSQEVFHSSKPYKLKKRSKVDPIKNLNTFVDYDKYEIFSMEDKLWLYPDSVNAFLKNYGTSLYVRNAGVFVGVNNRSELIPSHDLALSLALNKQIQSVEVDLNSALSFLRGEINFKAEGLSGWTIVSYQDHPLGWVKALPNRMNNYYPKEWRIRIRL